MEKANGRPSSRAFSIASALILGFVASIANNAIGQTDPWRTDQYFRDTDLGREQKVLTQFLREYRRLPASDPYRVVEGWSYFGASPLSASWRMKVTWVLGGQQYETWIDRANYTQVWANAATIAAAAAPVIDAYDPLAEPAQRKDVMAVETAVIETNRRIGDTDDSPAATDTADASVIAFLKRISGKIANDFGVTSGAIRVASIPGNVSGISDFGAGATTSQSQRVAANLHDAAGNGITSRSYDSVRPVEVYVMQYGASNATHTRITFVTGNVSTQIAAANTARKWLRIENDSGAEFFVKFGTTAVVNQGISVKDKTSFVMDATQLYLGAINAIVGSNNRTIEVVEGY